MRRIGCNRLILRWMDKNRAQARYTMSCQFVCVFDLRRVGLLELKRHTSVLRVHSNSVVMSSILPWQWLRELACPMQGDTHLRPPFFWDPLPQLVSLCLFSPLLASPYVLHRSLLHCTSVPYCTVPCCTVPYRAVPYRTVLYRTVPCRTVPH